jgi:Chlorophyll A-B binding protein
MQLAEIKHGRLAMIAIAGFAIQEYATQIGVVDETPLFFFPLPEAMERMIGA